MRMQEDTKTIGDKWLSWYSAPAIYGSSLGSNPDTLSKIQNGRHKQRSGQRTLTRQKNIHKKTKLSEQVVSHQLPTLERDGGVCWSLSWRVTLIKRKENFPHILGNSEGSGTKSYMTNELHIYDENICVFAHILGSPSSYMTMHLNPSEFPYI